jgi:hypothetical protein
MIVSATPMQPDGWLTAARAAAAARAGVAVEELDLDDARAELLLDMAGLAAHESGDRRNAPLLCYLLGRAERDVTLDEIAAAVRRAMARTDSSEEKEVGHAG